MEVRIIKGIYGKRDAHGAVEPVSCKDGPINLPNEEAERLIRLGVAEYCFDKKTELSDRFLVDHDTENPTTEEADADSGGDEHDTPDGEPDEGDTLDIVDGHFTAEGLASLTNNALRDLATRLGVDGKKCKTKADLVAALVAVDVEDDGPPALGVEAPVL